HGLSGRSRSSKEVQDDAVVLSANTKNSVNESDRLRCFENGLRALEVQELEHALLCLLRVSDVVVTPECLRDPAILNLRAEDLGSGDVIPIFTPPDPAVPVQLVEAFLRNPPVAPLRWPGNDAAAGTSDRVRSFTVVVAGSQVIRPPITSGVVVGVAIDGVLL